MKLMSRTELPYADLSLEDALVLFRSENGLSEKYDELSAAARAHYKRHDIIHVLFGLDTSIRQEAQADGWTLLASDISWADIKAFMALPEEKELIAEIGWWTLTTGFLRALPDYVSMAWRSRRMRKKWRWSAHQAYLQRSVGEIRAEFGIERALFV